MDTFSAACQSRTSTLASEVRELVPRASVLGLPVDPIGLDGAVAWIEAAITAARGVGTGTLPDVVASYATRLVVTLNPELVMAARRDAAFAALVHAADLVVPDGIGIVWALRLCGIGARQRRERVTGIDLLLAVAARSARTDASIYLLGAGVGVAQAAASRLRRRFPDAHIVGAWAGSPEPAADAETLTRIRGTGAEVVFVAYGAPAQERWIARNRRQLGAAVAVGVGGAFDIIAGQVPRAPGWMRAVGLEWLYRLWREPWRWRRMLALPVFAWLVGWDAVRRVAQRGRSPQAQQRAQQRTQERTTR